MRPNRSTLGAATLLVGCLALVAGCGGSSESGDDNGTTTSTVAVTVTTPIPGPTVTSEDTVADPPAPTGSSVPDGSVPPTTVLLLVPGQPCVAGSDPDCIDPFADGDFVYLVGGAACMAGPLGGPACADLDGDGRAGYPDSG
jgi:hypothetical protein